MAALSLCHLVPLCTAALVSWLCFGGDAYGAALFFCLRTRVLRSCELRHIPRVLAWTCVSIVARFCACLGYFIAFVPFLLCGSDTVSFALCLAMCFYDHRGLLMVSAATAMPFCRRRYKHRRLSICGMHCTAYTCDISSDGRRVVFAAVFGLFCVFYANCYGKGCVSVIFLFFSQYLAKLSSMLLSVFPILSGTCGFAGRLPAASNASSWICVGCSVIFALFYCWIKTHGWIRCWV